MPKLIHFLRLSSWPVACMQWFQPAMPVWPCRRLHFGGQGIGGMLPVICSYRSFLIYLLSLRRSEIFACSSLYHKQLQRQLLRRILRVFTLPWPLFGIARVEHICACSTVLCSSFWLVLSHVCYLKEGGYEPPSLCIAINVVFPDFGLFCSCRRETRSITETQFFRQQSCIRCHPRR
jgi:hypothetical protein